MPSCTGNYASRCGRPTSQRLQPARRFVDALVAGDGAPELGASTHDMWLVVPLEFKGGYSRLAGVPVRHRLAIRTLAHFCAKLAAEIGI